MTTSAMDLPLHRQPRPVGSTPSKAFSPCSTKRRLKRGVFKGVVDLQAAINRFVIDTTTSSPNPSSGPPAQTKSSPPLPKGTKRWIQSTSRTRHFSADLGEPLNRGTL